MLFAGLDVGTSGCKMLVYDLDGNVKASYSCSYIESGKDGYRELDPIFVLNSVKECIKNVTKQIDRPIKALAIASLGESAVCIDENENPLGKSMLTGDKRGIEEVEEIISIIPKKRIQEITGIPANEMYSLPKFLWMKKNTNTIKNSKYIFMYEDYLGYYLTGKRKISYSSASRTMAFDIIKKQWSIELLDIAGIRIDQLSSPVEAGTILGPVMPRIAKELGLSPETLILAGGHDQECAALGAGVICQDVAVDGHGTCEVMNIMLNGPLKTDYMFEHDMACIPAMMPESYMSNLEITTCGILMNWSRDNIFQAIRNECDARGENFFAYMDKVVSNIDTDILILPEFGSAGHPNISYDAKGLIWGLTIHTRPEEIYLAIKESMAFHMKMAYEHAKSLGINVKKIILTGGGAISDLTLQIRADVFGIETATLKNKEAGTLGCMMIAAKSLGYYSSFEEAIKRAVKIKKSYYPIEKNKERYQERYEKYKRLYNLMHGFE